MISLTKIFGNTGIVRFEYVKDDGEEGQGTMHIETFGNSKAEIEENIKNVIFVEKGVRMTSIKLIGFSEQ